MGAQRTKNPRLLLREPSIECTSTRASKTNVQTHVYLLYFPKYRSHFDYKSCPPILTTIIVFKSFPPGLDEETRGHDFAHTVYEMVCLTVNSTHTQKKKKKKKKKKTRKYVAPYFSHVKYHVKWCYLQSGKYSTYFSQCDKTFSKL